MFLLLLKIKNLFNAREKLKMQQNVAYLSKILIFFCGEGCPTPRRLRCPCLKRTSLNAILDLPLSPHKLASTSFQRTRQ